MNDEDLERRLRAADPATPDLVRSERTRLPTGRTLAELVEATMSTDLTRPAPAGKPRAWRLGALAAAVAATILASGIYLLTGHDSAGKKAANTAPKSVLTLSLPKAPSGPTMRTCIRFSAETLAPMQVAFSGTVTASSADSVTINVDHWYRGGTADAVRLTVPDPSVPTTAEGMVELIKGHRYLVTANDGMVTTCGFTTEWTQAGADTFHTAFGR